MNCFYCGAISFIKNGIIKGKQRYRCKSCGANQVANDKKNITKNCKRLTVILYLNGIKVCSIARLFQVSHVTVLKWLFQYRQGLDSLRQNTNEETILALQSLAPLSIPVSDQDLHELEQRIFSIIIRVTQK